MATGLEIKHVREIHLIKWLFILLLISAVAAMGYFGYRWYDTGEMPPLPIPIASADPSIDETPVTKKQVDEYTVSPTHPRYLSIPALGISKTRVTTVGVTQNGLLDVPNNINDVAWYTKSSTPGEGTGAVMIDGHNGGFSHDGVFAKLSTMKKGDEIHIERGDGKQFTYAVYDVRDMPLEEVNKTGMKELMYSAEPDKEGLSLITCSGKWIPKDQVFDHRIMLRAVRTELTVKLKRPPMTGPGADDLVVIDGLFIIGGLGGLA